MAPTPNPYNYFGFVCGEKKLKNCEVTWEDKQNPVKAGKILERAKAAILNTYYVVGILEEFDNTLKLLEKMLPEYYSGAFDLSKSKQLQKAKDKTATLSYPKMSNESRQVLMNGPLRYE